jgi:hypothetical protein
MQNIIEEADKRSSERSFISKLILIYPFRFLLFSIAIFLLFSILGIVWKITALNLDSFFYTNYNLVLDPTSVFVLAYIVAILSVAFYTFSLIVFYRIGKNLHTLITTYGKSWLLQKYSNLEVSKVTELQTLEHVKAVRMMGFAGVYLHIAILPVILFIIIYAFMEGDNSVVLLIIAYFFTLFTSVFLSSSPYLAIDIMYKQLAKISEIESKESLE